MVNIQTRHDTRRGCGWRQPGGTYLIAEGISLQPCGLLSIHLTTCPTCSCGIKPSRGWTWLDVKALVKGLGRECASGPSHCASCPLSPMNVLGGKQGLIWIGGSFYAKPEDWTNEAIKQGVSRRLSAVPTNFKLGETWVLVAHREAITVPCPDCVDVDCETCEGTRFVKDPAIFHAFKPSAIEYVVKGDEPQELLERLVKRGITPVTIVRVGEQKEFDEVEEAVEV